jgi:signal transduction histidine kinase
MKMYFTVDAQSVLTLGRDSIKDHTTALIELVKNSYDADATKVDIEVYTKAPQPFIKISDNGSGMTQNDIKTKWLRIGFSEKKENTVTIRGRRKTGEKGIGRISSDRLGSVLELRTKTEKVQKPIGLIINWEEFSKKGRTLDRVPLKSIENPELKIPTTLDNKVSASGTELIIYSLRNSWDQADIEKLERELSMFTSPFKQFPDFIITLRTDVEGVVTEQEIEPTEYESALLELKANYNENENVVYYTYKEINKKKEPKQSIPLTQLFQIKTGRKKQDKFSSEDYRLACGPVSLILRFYVRNPEPLKGVSINTQAVIKLLNNHAGVRIYRDDIRVKPYGDIRGTEWDWLNLGKRQARDPAGAGRPTFKITPSQLVGAVLLSRDSNSKLNDSSSREGLIESDAFSDLKGFVLGCVELLETKYHTMFATEKEARKPSSVSGELKVLNKEMGVVLANLRDLSPMIARASEETVEQTAIQLESIITQISKAQTSLREVLNQNVIYRGLATIGIASATFGHETEMSIASFINSTQALRKYLGLTPPNINEAISQADKSEIVAEKIASWGAFALTRIQRDKRRRKRVDVQNVITNIVNELAPAFEASEIEIRRNFNGVIATVFQMDVEAIVINLMTNAYAACKNSSRKRLVSIELNNKVEDEVEGFEIKISDSGPGIAKEFQERIWEPLFTTKADDQDQKQVGTGLGLSIVDSIILESSGKRSQTKAPKLHGAEFSIWLPLKQRS